MTFSDKYHQNVKLVILNRLLKLRENIKNLCYIPWIEYYKFMLYPIE